MAGDMRPSRGWWRELRSWALCKDLRLWLVARVLAPAIPWLVQASAPLMMRGKVGMAATDSLIDWQPLAAPGSPWQPLAAGY